MGLVVGVLDLPAALRFIQRSPHGGSYRIGVHNDPPLGISGGTADGLDQTGFASQETLLVRIQNGHQTDLRQVQALTKQIDAYQHIEFGHTQIPDDLHALHGTDVRMHIAHPDAGLLEVHRQILRHFLGQGGHQHPLIFRGSGVDLTDEIVDLAVNGPHFHNGIQQSRGADHLLHDLTGPGPLILGGGGRHIDHLIDLAVELRKVQGTVVVGRRQAEAVVHQSILAAPVTGVHSAGLGQCHMALVNEHDKIFREVVQQCGGGRTRRTALDHPGIVLDAVAEADLRQHLQVIGSPLGNALGFDQLVILPEELHLLIALDLDLVHGPLELLLGGYIVGSGIDGHMIDIPLRHAGNGVDLADPIHLIAEKFHPDGLTGPVGGVDLQGIAPEAELVTGEIQVIALVADLRQLSQHIIQGIFLSHPEGNDHGLIVDGVAQAVQAGNRGHHDHIPPLKEGGGGRVPQTVDLLVDGGILFDIGIRVGDIGLGLVVVVVGNKILHRVVREKFPEFAAQLGRQRLIMG